LLDGSHRIAKHLAAMAEVLFERCGDPLDAVFLMVRFPPGGAFLAHFWFIIPNRI
jgi:hypothetical protein